MKKLILVVSGLLYAQTIITHTNWPYGLDQIGNQWQWYANASPVPVNMDSLINQTNVWHFETGPTARIWTSTLVPLSQVPGTPPPGSQFAEMQQIPGNPLTYMYESENSNAMFVYGFYNQSYGQIVFTPYWIPYDFPMQVGTKWISSFQWEYYGITVYEEYVDTVIKGGTLYLPDPLGGPYPCLVIRQKYRAWDDYGIINEHRYNYEWVVPNLGVAAFIGSQSPEYNPYFTVAEYYIRLKSATLNETSPPTFSDTRLLTPSSCYGPFVVRSKITDPAGILKDSLYYKISTGGWVRVYHDSVRNNFYYYTIPAVTPPVTVQYYLVAYDNSTNQNRGTDPQGAPINTYSFFFIDPQQDNYPPKFYGTTIWSDTSYAGPYPIKSTIKDSGGCVDLALLYYRIGGSGSYTAKLPDSVKQNTYYFKIPSVVPPTVVEYYLLAQDMSTNGNVGYDPQNAPSSVYRFNVLDRVPPTFIGTTVWRDTAFNGPFPVKSIIKDPAGIAHAKIYFKIHINPWDSLPSDSMRGDTFYFHIPPITQTSVIRYYLKAKDNNQNVGRDPANPTQFYQFIATYVNVEESFLKQKEISFEVNIKEKKLILFVPYNDFVSLRVYDAVGRTKKTFINGNINRGIYEFNFKGLKKGVYYFVLNSQKHKKIERILILR
ncbi:MAG: T9SS type A sorting domain-containing protein [Candidatus Hydrothermales bacterium]